MFLENPVGWLCVIFITSADLPTKNFFRGTRHVKKAVPSQKRLSGLPDLSTLRICLEGQSGRQSWKWYPANRSDAIFAGDWTEVPIGTYKFSAFFPYTEYLQGHVHDLRRRHVHDLAGHLPKKLDKYWTLNRLLYSKWWRGHGMFASNWSRKESGHPSIKRIDVSLIVYPLAYNFSRDSQVSHYKWSAHLLPVCMSIRASRLKKPGERATNRSLKMTLVA